MQVCVDLVRHLDASNRADSQAIVTRLATLLPQRSQGAPADIVDLLARGLSQILDELSPRRRAILQRCDVHGENATGVAKSLHISRRQLYRERRTALRWISQRLFADPMPPRSQPISVMSDRCADHVALSQALENGGHWRPAADMLERLADDLDNPDQRADIEIHLAYLYLRSDRLAMARDRTEIARALARRVRAGHEWREAEADVLAADVALGAWDVRTAAQLAHRSASQLESWASGAGDIRIHNALANALLVESAVLMGRGEIESARALVGEARDITEHNERIDRRLRITAQSKAAALDIFSGLRLEKAELDLKECYRQALLFGLTNDALGVAARLAGAYRLQKRPQAAIDLLGAPAEMSSMFAWQERARVLYELSNAFIEIGDLRAAHIHVVALCEMVVGNAARQGPAQLTVARLHVALQDWAPALLAAEAAETSFEQLGLGRLIGEALLLQIKALIGLGEPARARRIMTAAIGSIEMTNTGGRLAAAYKLMAQVSGQAKYASAARRLLRNIGAKEHSAPGPRSSR